MVYFPRTESTFFMFVAIVQELKTMLSKAGETFVS